VLISLPICGFFVFSGFYFALLGLWCNSCNFDVVWFSIFAGIADFAFIVYICAYVLWVRFDICPLQFVG